MSKTLDEIKAMVDAIEDDDPVREILTALVEKVEELEERVSAPPVKPGKKP